MKETNPATEAGIDEGAVARFADSLRGDLIRPGQSGYEDSRKVWNGLVDKRPSLIARCANTATRTPTCSGESGDEAATSAWSFRYRLHPVGPVLGGMVIYPLSSNVLRFFDEFSSTAPDEVSTVGLLLTAPDGTLSLAILACHCGPLEEGERVLAPLRTFGPAPADMIQPREYVEMQSITDEGWPPGRLYYWKSSLVRKLSDELIDGLIEYARQKPTPQSLIFLQQLHGYAGRIGAADTAFSHRFDHYDCGALLQTEDPAEVEKGIEWSRRCWEAIQPYVERRNYVNDLGEGGEQRVREAYGPSFERLAALKSKYDPTNLFHSNQNIRPGGEAEAR